MRKRIQIKKTEKQFDTSKKYYTPQQLAEYMRSLPGGQVFKIEYYSKKEGGNIIRTGQNKVKKYLKGIGKGYSDASVGVVTYYDCIKQSYRSPRVENIKSITFGKEIREVR